MHKRLTVHDIIDFKKKREPIAALTAYDTFTAKFLDRAGIDLILVGDSMNMVIYGEETTLTLDIEQSIYHTRAVAKGLKRAFLVGDMPFMSYQPSVRDAVKNAGKLIKAGAQSVKLEGGRAAIPHIKSIVNSGIPVMGHIGMTPQSIHKFGGYKLVGKNDIDADRVKEAALALEKAGVFSLVLEKVPSDLASEITAELSIPTIGIGAGAKCDGQILVVNDILGLFDEFQPKFARKYANLSEDITKAAEEYLKDVKKGNFPSEKESYS